MVLDESDIKVLADMKRQRGVVKASLTHIKRFVRKFDPREQAVSLLEFRQEELPLINRKFDDIQSLIELLSIDEDVQAKEDSLNFEQYYFSIRSKIQEIINLEINPRLLINQVRGTSRSIYCLDVAFSLI